MRSTLLFVRVVLVLILTGITVNTVFAQNGEIRGTVKDRNNEPIAGARVTVTPLNGGSPRGAIGNRVYTE